MTPLKDAIAALTSPPPTCLMLDDPLFKDDPQRAPLLVELLHSEPSHYLLLQQSIALALEQAEFANGSHSICGWLFTGAPLKQLQRDLRKRLDAHYPNGVRVYLRYFDPRVLPRLLQLLAPSADTKPPHHCSLAQFLGPVRIWCQIGYEGQLLRHENSQTTSDVLSGPLRFDETTAAAIDRIEPVNMTMRTLEHRAIRRMQSEAATIDSHLLTAQRLGIHDGEDQVAFAWRAVQYGTQFTLHPMLQELTSLATTHGIPLDAVLDEHFPSHAVGDIRT